MMEDIRLEAHIRLALAPTGAEMERMRARLQQSIQEEAVWRTFTTIMVQSRRNIQVLITQAQASSLRAAQYHRLGG